MNQNDIGLKRGTVKLVQYNPTWAQLFEQEKELLKKTFGDTIIAIEHIGSTAIPGMIAKPIIDIDIAIDSLDTALTMKDKFEKIGYEHRPAATDSNINTTKDQELYVKGPEENRTHYVHVTVYNSDCWKNDLLFRDYLRKNPSRTKEYGDLKEKLAQKFADDRKMYTSSKKQFILETLELAKNTAHTV